MSVTKERIDVLLVELGFYESREKAKAAVMAGLVLVNTERVEKVGTKISRDSAITVKGALHPYVSRGGLKLEKAIRFFDIKFDGKTMIDIGASTGGFTDCALKNGAVRVYAVDVGYNQLDWSLRNDERVVVMERTNFRYMTLEQLNNVQPHIATIDVSFISLKLILPPLMEILSAGGEVMALIKPQFEAGRDKVGKSGVIRDSAVHVDVLTSVLSFARELGFQLRGVTYSPITGGEGNIEFLAYWNKPGEEAAPKDMAHPDQLNELCETVVDQAAKTFRG